MVATFQLSNFSVDRVAGRSRAPTEPIAQLFTSPEKLQLFTATPIFQALGHLFYATSHVPRRMNLKRFTRLALPLAGPAPPSIRCTRHRPMTRRTTGFPASLTAGPGSLRSPVPLAALVAGDSFAGTPAALSPSPPGAA